NQNNSTNDYIIILYNNYLEHHCVKCDEIYTIYKWCKLCQINYLKENFTNWTSENNKLNYFIRKMQLNINNPKDIVFEWIPYNQFNFIKVIRKYNDFATAYSAKRKDDPLEYNANTKKYERNSNREIALKYFHNTQNINE